MPEQGNYDSYDYDQEPVAQRGDYLVKVPRGAVRHLEDKAKKWDEAVARAVAEMNGEPPTDTPLENGEARMTHDRRALSSAAPPDVPQGADPYKEAEELYKEGLADGLQEKKAWGNAFNSVVGAAAQGDRRVIIRDQQQQYRGPGPR